MSKKNSGKRNAGSTRGRTEMSKHERHTTFIPLNNSTKPAWCAPEDQEYLSQFDWFMTARGYVGRHDEDGNLLYMHDEVVARHPDRFGKYEVPLRNPLSDPPAPPSFGQKSSRRSDYTTSQRRGVWADDDFMTVVYRSPRSDDPADWPLNVSLGGELISDAVDLSIVAGYLNDELAAAHSSGGKVDVEVLRDARQRIESLSDALADLGCVIGDDYTVTEKTPAEPSPERANLRLVETQESA